MAEGRKRPRGESFSGLNAELSRAVVNFGALTQAAHLFGQALSTFRIFEVQLARANAAAGGTVAQMRQMGAAARGFALSMTATATDAANALFFMSQAGFSVEQSLNSMSAVLVLAQATMQDVAFTADLVASTLRTYELTSLDAMRVSNLFAAAQVNSLASLDKLAFSLRQAGPPAAAFGQEIETTVAYLSTLYNVGLRGEQAGTALRNVMVRLVNPIGNARAALERYGISTRDATGGLRELEEVLIDLHNAGISEAELIDIFGVEALSGAVALIRSAGEGTFQRLRDEISGTNAAFDLAVRQINTFDGALRLMQNAITELQLMLGEQLAPALSNLALMVRELVISFREMSPGARNLVTSLVGLVAVVTALGLGIRALVFAFRPVLDLLLGVGRLAGSLFTGVVGAVTRVGASAATALTSVKALGGALGSIAALRFAPLLLGLTGVGGAIIGAGGLLYSVYRLTAAWIENKNEALAAARAAQDALLDAAGVDKTRYRDTGARIQEFEAATRSASAMSGLDRVNALRGISKGLDRESDYITEIRRKILLNDRALLEASSQASDSRIMEAFDGAFGSGWWTEMVQGTVGISARGLDRGALNQLDSELESRQNWFSEYADKQRAWFESFDVESVSRAQQEAAQKMQLLGKELSDLERGGSAKDVLDGVRAQLSAVEAEFRLTTAELERHAAGISADPVISSIDGVSENIEIIRGYLARLGRNENLTFREAQNLRQAYSNLRESIEQAGDEMESERAAFLAEFTHIEALGAQISQLSRDSVLRSEMAIRRFIDEMIAGDYSLTELLGTAAPLLQEALAGNQTQIYETLSSVFEGNDAVTVQQILAALRDSEGINLPSEVIDAINNVLSSKERAITNIFTDESKRSRQALTRLRQQYFQILSQNAETLEDALEYARLADLENLQSVIEGFADRHREGIEKMAAEAPALFNAGEIGKTLLDAMTLGGGMDELRDMAAQGASYDELRARADEILAQNEAEFIRLIGLALAQQTIMWDQANILIGEWNRLREHLETSLSLQEATAGATEAGIRKRFAPRGGRGGGGKDPAKEARRIARQYEDAVITIANMRREAARTLLDTDPNIDLTTRISMGLDLDIADIAAKYDQQLMRLKREMEEIEEKFQGQPLDLERLRNEYGMLIDEVERAKQAEIAYTNTFTGMIERRNKALQTHIDHIRNASMETQNGHQRIMMGLQAGLLQYQMNLRTTVDNVATATVSVLDGMAEAVGAFVTGTGDAMEMLRNSILSALNQLIVDATKRLFQQMAAGLTGALNPGGSGGVAGAAAGAAGGGGGGGGFLSRIFGALTGRGGGEQGAGAGSVIGGDPMAQQIQQLQMIVNTFLQQMQTVLSAFVQQLQVTLTTIMQQLGGADIGMLGGSLGGSGGLGGLGGIFSLFGGLFSKGGRLGANRWGIAGEDGPEIITGPANIMSTQDTARMLGGGAAAPVVNYEPPVINNIIVQDPAVVERYIASSEGQRQISNIVNRRGAANA